jgi:hypothetical protein
MSGVVLINCCSVVGVAGRWSQAQQDLHDACMHCAVRCCQVYMEVEGSGSLRSWSQPAERVYAAVILHYAACRLSE